MEAGGITCRNILPSSANQLIIIPFIQGKALLFTGILKLCTSELLFIYLFSEHVHDSASEHVEVIANSKSVSHMWTGELWRPERLQKSRPLLTFHPRTLAPKRQQ